MQFVMRFRFVYKYVIVLHTYVCTNAHECDRMQEEKKYQLNTIECPLPFYNLNIV